MLVRDLVDHPLYLQKWKKNIAITDYFLRSRGGVVLGTVSSPLVLDYKIVKYWKCVELFSALT